MRKLLLETNRTVDDPVFQRFPANDTAMFETIYRLYASAFPPSEQKSKALLWELVNRENYRLFTLTLGHRIVGFAVFFTPAEPFFHLLEYMAVDAQWRSRGLGLSLMARSIQTLFDEFGPKPLIIEIDSPQEECPDRSDRIRRERFYRRCGCKTIRGFDYVLGLKTEHLPPRMNIMVRDPMHSLITQTHLRRCIETIYTDVYGRLKEDPDIIGMFKNLPEKLQYDQGDKDGMVV